MSEITVHHGECLDVLAEMPDNSVDAIVTDPPYGLGFMGKKWDELPPGEDWARECLRVLKPGGHMLAFGGTRTWHRLAVAVEDAGFEIRDSIAWMYGSGFPKSMDVSKAIDKAAGADRPVVGANPRAAQQTPKAGVTTLGAFAGTSPDLTAPATPDAERWQGWGTALKPAFEPIVFARKPLAGTVAANVLEHGTGALNVDACRIGTEHRVNPAAGNKAGGAALNMSTVGMPADVAAREATGRWPANVVLDEGQAHVLDLQAPNAGAAARATGPARTGANAGNSRGLFAGTDGVAPFHDDRGGASRFFYVAKAPKRERPVVDGVAHTTVKPLTLMRWLVRLITPPGGTVLDTFAGSGTTVEACILEDFDCIAIEQEAEYLPLIGVRIERARRAA